MIALALLWACAPVDDTAAEGWAIVACPDSNGVEVDDGAWVRVSTDDGYPVRWSRLPGTVAIDCADADGRAVLVEWRR